MDTLFFLIIVGLLSQIYACTHFFEESKLELSEKLRVMNFSHDRLFAYSRTIVFIILIDFLIVHFFPKITLSKLIIVLLILVFTIIHIWVYLFSMAAYDLLKK